MIRSVKSAVVSLLLAFATVQTAAAQSTNDISLVSRSTAGTPGDGQSVNPGLDSTGQLVVFESDAANLVAGDNGGFTDIFLHDRATGTTVRMSQSSTGIGGNAASNGPAISSSGQFVVFHSAADNLAGVDSEGQVDVFRVDRNPSGGEEPVIRVSADGAGVGGNGSSTNASVSSDGRFVVFQSDATNLVAGDTNAVTDIFYFDDTDAVTPIRRVSVDPVGAVQGDGPSTSPAMSDDGAFIVFQSEAVNLVDGDTNGASDIFLFDRNAGTLARISVDGAGIQGNGPSTAPAISYDGRYVVFQSLASNFVNADTANSDIFLYDRVADTLTRVSESESGAPANGNSFAPSISGDGVFVTFLSDATNLVAGDTNNTAGSPPFDVFVVDTASGVVTRENVPLSGAQVQNGAGNPVLDEDGTVAAFDSESADLVPGDPNLVSDIFVTDTDCPSDSDSDGTADCTDECPTDPDKTAAGSCGCGIPDTDADSDGTAACIDQCEADAAKTAPGVCGCGVSDADTNGNGAADCLDPTAQTIPDRPRPATVRNGTVLVRLPDVFQGVTYRVQLLRNGRAVRTVTTTKRRVRFRNLSPGNYRVRYTVSLGDVTSQRSRPRRVRVR